jgi:hypothetical protein
MSSAAGIATVYGESGEQGREGMGGIPLREATLDCFMICVGLWSH